MISRAPIPRMQICLPNITFLKGEAVTDVDTKAASVTLSSGDSLSYEKLLLATGATPVIPPVSGLEDVPHHVLRTLDDAMTLRSALENKHTALVIGAGLIGMHAAENLAKIGVEVTVVEALPHVLPHIHLDALLTEGLLDQRGTTLIKVLG